MHKPILRERPDADTLVILIHGFFGSPDQMQPFAEAAYRCGCSTLTLLLPGHSGSGIDFARSSRHAWRWHVKNALETYRSKYRKIFFVGHSMGCLLALQAASENDAALRGLFLIAPPMRLNYITHRALSSRIKILFSPHTNGIKRAYRDAVSVEKTPLFVYPLWLHPAAELMKLILETQRRLRDVRVPVSLVFSRYDETIAVRSADILCDGLTHAPHEVLMLRHSWHAYYTKAELDIINRRLVRFLQARRSP